MLAKPQAARSNRHAQLLSASQRRSVAGRSFALHNPRHSLKHGFAWLAAGNIVNAACAWGRVAVLAHQGNSDVIGQLVLAWAVCNPISSLLDLGLSTVLVSDARHEFRTRDYVYLRLTTGLATLLAIGVMLLIGGQRTANAVLILIAGVAVVSESVCEIFQAQLQRCEAMPWVSFSLIVRGVLGLIAFAGIHRATGSIVLAVAGLAAAALVTLFAIDIPTALHFSRGRRWSSEIEAVDRASASSRSNHLAALVRLGWLSLPLGLATAGLDLTTALPRYAINHLFGPSALGSFAVAGGLMVASSLILGALSQAAGPRLARLYAAGDFDQFLSLTGRLLGLVAALSAMGALGILFAGKPALYLLYGPKYMLLDRLAALLMVVAGLRNMGMLLNRILSSMRKFRLNLALRLAGLVVLAALLPGWVPSYGVWGAAWAVGLSWIVTSLFSLAAVLYGTNLSRLAKASP